jgi:hypothetical protein
MPNIGKHGKRGGNPYTKPLSTSYEVNNQMVDVAKSLFMDIADYISNLKLLHRTASSNGN